MVIAVVDNDGCMLKIIKHCIEIKFPMHCLLTFSSVHDLLKCEVEIDILLLDIEMPDANGMQFAKKYYKEFPCIVFISSHEECVFEAIDINIAGFIVKNNNMEERLIDKINILEKYKNDEFTIMLNTTKGKMSIKGSEILYFINEEDCIFMVYKKGRVRLTITSLLKLHKKLSCDFFMVNRNSIINVKQVNIICKKTHEVVLCEDLRIKVSERRWKDLLTVLNRVVNIG